MPNEKFVLEIEFDAGEWEGPAGVEASFSEGYPETIPNPDVDSAAIAALKGETPEEAAIVEEMWRLLVNEDPAAEAPDPPTMIQEIKAYAVENSTIDNPQTRSDAAIEQILNLVMQRALRLGRQKAEETRRESERETLDRQKVNITGNVKKLVG